MSNTPTQIRTVDINGTAYLLQCYDPYGFWKVAPASPMDNFPHEILDGNYTTADHAITAVRSVDPATITPARKREDKVLTAKVR